MLFCDKPLEISKRSKRGACPKALTTTEKHSTIILTTSFISSHLPAAELKTSIFDTKTSQAAS